MQAMKTGFLRPPELGRTGRSSADKAPQALVTDADGERALRHIATHPPHTVESPAARAENGRSGAPLLRPRGARRSLLLVALAKRCLFGEKTGRPREESQAIAGPMPDHKETKPPFPNGPRAARFTIGAGTTALGRARLLTGKRRRSPWLSFIHFNGLTAADVTPQSGKAVLWNAVGRRK